MALTQEEAKAIVEKCHKLLHTCVDGLTEIQDEIEKAVKDTEKSKKEEKPKYDQDTNNQTSTGN